MSLISEKTDGMILLVSLDKVPFGLPLNLRIMKKSGAEFLGIIINSTKESNNDLLTNKGYGYGDIYAICRRRESFRRIKLKTNFT